MSFGYELISEIDRLADFPKSGRIVPEYRNDNIREIVFRPYRMEFLNYKKNITSDKENKETQGALKV